MVQMQQLSLLTESRNIIAAAGAISVLKASMRSVADSSPYSRDQIADCMTAISLASGKRLTAGRAKSLHKDTIDKWLNPEEADHVPSIQALMVFCLAVGSTAPFVALVEALGGDVEIMTPEDKMYRDLGKGLHKQEQDAKKIRQLKLKIQEVIR